MAADLTVDADLTFSVGILGSRTVTGTLTGSGKSLQLQVSDPFLFAGRSDSGSIRRLAGGLADKGLSITVVTSSGPLITLGATRTSWLQRRLTGSRHIRVEQVAGLWSLIRGRAQAPAGGALPARELAPSSTLWPIAPTMQRRRRLPVTTTHDPRGGGNPRMIMAPPPYPTPEDRQEIFLLRDDVTTIGSDESCDIWLTGLQASHAEIRHDAQDEFVLVRTDDEGSMRVNGTPVDRSVLRTGSRVQLGDWTMSFFREEYADHGRPYGGRIGGELGHQRTQPSRTEIRRHEEHA